MLGSSVYTVVVLRRLRRSEQARGRAVELLLCSGVAVPLELLPSPPLLTRLWQRLWGCRR